jgi:tetratricopeptide (TPR) repeat protein
MPDQIFHHGQRNVTNHGDHNTIIPGDNNIITIHQAPPLPPPSPLHQLRAPVGDFVGRENEITALLATLKHDGESNTASISGISGLGGIGKTELAYVVAAHLAPQYPDAQLVVDLRGTDAVPRPPADALAECVRAFAGLEVRLPDDEATLVRLYRECLTGRRVLVVLDDAAADEQVRPFLPPPGCALLVTSRATLHLPGLRTRIQLDEFTPAEARALLQEMVPRVTDAVADQICSLCGYLPLAVRAAGGLLDVTPDLDPAEYAEELRDTRARLALRYANAEGHNISVEASFQLSYQRLPEEAARVFRALAVFPADFDGAAVEAIAADAGRLQLRELLRRNLVRYNAETKRFRLHDLARVFADAQASEAGRAVWQFAHARYFCKLLWEVDALYKAGGAKLMAGLALYDRDEANIVAGQAWAAHLALVFTAAARLCLDYADVGVYVISLRLHAREWIRWLEAQLAAARHMKEYEYESAALGNLGLAYAELGELPRAIEFYKQQLVIARELGDQCGEGNALGNLGVAYRNMGEPLRAIEFHEKGFAIAREIGDRRGESADLGNLGLAYSDLEEPHRAVEFYQQALVINREIGDLRGEGIDLWNQAEALEQLGDRAQAIACAEAALLIFEAIESPNAKRVRKRLAEWRQ